jgi:hypothetical protein
VGAVFNAIFSPPIAYAVQAARHGDLSGSNLEFQIEPGISRASTYTARSMADKKARSTGSSWEAAATMIAGACANCFAPHQSKITEGHVKPSEDAQDVSTSSSKFSFFLFHPSYTCDPTASNCTCIRIKGMYVNLIPSQIRCGRPSKFDPCKNAKL